MRTILATILVSAAAFSQAGNLLGIDNSAIYKINSATGASTVVGSLTGHGTGDANALAYNPATNMAYFQRNGKLWSMNASTGAANNLNVAVGDIASAAFYNGSYYYIEQGNGKLSKVAFSGLTAGSPTLLKDYTDTWGFGDIAINSAGKLYASSGNSIFSIDLTQPTLSVVSESTKGIQSQLGFVGNTLYGITTGNAPGGTTGQMFTFAGVSGMTATGYSAHMGSALLAVRDASSMEAVPEPASIAALGVGVAAMIRRRRKA